MEYKPPNNSPSDNHNPSDDQEPSENYESFDDFKPPGGPTYYNAPSSENIPPNNYRPSNKKKPCNVETCGDIPPGTTALSDDYNTDDKNTQQNDYQPPSYNNPYYDFKPPNSYKWSVYKAPYGKEPPWLSKLLKEQAYKSQYGEIPGGHGDFPKYKQPDKNKPPCDEETTDSKYTAVKKIHCKSVQSVHKGRWQHLTKNYPNNHFLDTNPPGLKFLLNSF